MRTIPLQTGIIYGPIRSRRLGWSLGLNASPTSYKLCSFNCVYCHYGWTNIHTADMTDRLGDLPTPGAFERALTSALYEHRDKEINNITFSGNGEATLHPRFEELVDIAKNLKEEYAPQAKLGILSNSSAVHKEEVRRALVKLDFKIMKLDGGNLKTFRKINHPCQAVDYETIVNSLKSLGDLTTQTFFVDGSICNTGEREVEEWVARISEIKPAKAQIYSLHRPPAESTLREVPGERLREIAARTEAATGVSVEVIIATSPYSRRYNEPYKKDS